jgi:hypothetical protein
MHTNVAADRGVFMVDNNVPSEAVNASTASDHFPFPFSAFCCIFGYHI